METKKEIIHEYMEQIKILQPERKLKNIKAFKKKYIEAMLDAKPVQRIAFGNKKIPKSTAITNMTSWFNCPGRTKEFCNICEICYDKFREVMNKNVCKSRLNHEIWFRTTKDIDIAFAICGKIIKEDRKKNNNKIKLHRWNEVGELRNQKDLEKVNNISNYINEIVGIKSYIYTHNKNLDFDIDRPNLTINGSNFMVDNEFKCIEKELYEEYVETHECYECLGDCEKCDTICSKKLNIVIVEKLKE